MTSLATPTSPLPTPAQLLAATRAAYPAFAPDIDALAARIAAAPPASAPPPAVADYTVVAGRALHLQADGQVRKWDFGEAAARLPSALTSAVSSDFDELSRVVERGLRLEESSPKSAPYDVLKGYNAAHVYDVPGDHTVCDDAGGKKIVRVVPSVGPVIDAPSNSDLFTLIAAAAPNATLRLARGGTYNVPATIYVRHDLSVIAADGTGALPRVVMNGSAKTYAFYVLSGAHLALNGIEIDSTKLFVPGSVAKVDRHGVCIWEGSFTGRNLRFRNVDDAVHGSPGAKGIYLADSEATGELRACLVWVDGTDYVILGNKAVNSYFEHIIRSSEMDVRRVNVQFNDFANPPASTKETLTFRNGQLLYAANNTFRAGWVQVSQGDVQPVMQAAHVVIENNTLTDGAWIQINPMCEDVLVSGNQVIDGAAPNIACVRATGACRASVVNNTWKTTATNHAFILRSEKPAAVLPTVTESGNVILPRT